MNMISQPSTQKAGYAYAMLAAALWSFVGPISHICFAEGVQPMEAAFWRAVLGGGCFFLHAALHRELSIPFVHALGFTGFGVIGIGVFFSAYLLAIRDVGAGTAVILVYTAPAWVAVFSRILFREALSSRKMFALGVAMCGTFLVCLSGGSFGGASVTTGLAFGLVAGFTYAMHYPFYVWWKERYSTATLFAFMLLGGALSLLPFVAFSEKSMTAWACLFALGILTNYAAYLAYGQGLRRISPVRAAIISNLEPVLATFFAWFFWGESFAVAGWSGAALVLAAVFILTTERSQVNEGA